MKTGSYTKILKNQNGSILIGMVVIMMIFAALGAAMMSMSKTSTFSQIWTSGSSQAYFLAESGFRYAETEYKNTYDSDGDGEKIDDRNLKLINWNSPDPPASPVLFTFNKEPQEPLKKFELKIYPYFLVTATAHAAGATSLQAKFPGSKPSGLTIPAAPGKLKIKGIFYNYTGYTYDSGTRIYTFSLAGGLKSHISDNMDAYLVSNSASDGIFFTKGGNLVLNDASFFPDNNGVVRIYKSDGSLYLYDYGYKSRSGNTLEDLFDVNDPNRTFNFTLDSSYKIVLYPFAKFHSSGIVDYGSGSESIREIIYDLPIEPDENEKIQDIDTFENKSKWEVSTLGTHIAETVGTNKALKVTGTGILGGNNKGSLIKLKWGETNVNLAVAHKRSGHYLSYDAQVKTGFTTGTVPFYGFYPAPIPKYYAAGLSFRLDTDGNGFGLSFLRGDNSLAIPTDGIPDAIVPYTTEAIIFSNGGINSISKGDTITGVSSGANAVVLAAPEVFYGSWAGEDAAGSLKLGRLSGSFQSSESLQKNGVDVARVRKYEKNIHNIVLWQNIGSGSLKTWLAFKALADRVFFFDSIEGNIVWATSGSSSTVKWNTTPHRSSSASHAWYYGNPANWTYNTPLSANHGSLRTPSITLPADCCPKLSFMSWHRTEGGTLWDRKTVSISTFNGSTWSSPVQIYQVSGTQAIWVKISPVNLSAYAGETIKIIFKFDTIDRYFNQFEGWYIDDVKVYADFPVQESTLMIRLIESPSIDFINGSDGGGAFGIRDGDILVGQTSGATATVRGEPIVKSGTWSADSAAGTILVKSMPVNFSDEESITVSGSSATAMAKNPIVSRANYVRVYYGDTSGCQTPDGNLLDCKREANIRNGDINWPPDKVADWAANKDYFTLIKWDKVNGSESSVSLVSSIDEPGSILKSTESDLFTPSYGTFAQSELGLHTFGDGSTNIYFDDFALQTEIVSTGRFLPSIQR